MATVVDRAVVPALTEVDRELKRRFDLSDGARENGDLVVLLGLLNACPSLTPAERREACRADPFTAVERWDLDVARFGAFQRLWYRLRVPFGVAPLYWWYLLTLGLRDPSRDLDDAGEALTAWLEALAVAGPAQRAAALAGAPGSCRGDVVVATGDLEDTALLAEAIARDAPLVLVSGAADLDELRGAGWTPIESPSADLPSHALPGLGELAAGRPLHLAAITARTRAAWSDLEADERTLVLVHLEQRLGALEQMRLTCGGEPKENAAVVGVIGSCRATAPEQWSYEQLCFVTLARCWERGGFILQELNQALLTLPLIAAFIARRLEEYGAICGLRDSAPAELVAAATELGRLRAAVERTHWRCIQFDGSNWERREFVVAKALRDAYLDVPDGLADLLASRFGVELADRCGSGPAWDAYLEAILAEGHTPTQLICAVADWAADDDLLPVDAAIFTAPRGVKLESPWEIEIHEVFCYTAFRDGFDPREHGMPLDFTGMRNAIGQRMRYNVVKKAQNYAVVKRFKPQSFNLPDIAVAEDANHAGHRAGGIRLSMRLPTWVSYRGNEWKGIADVRLNRGGYRRERRFRPSDVIVGSRYTAWEKGIVDATFARDLLFDGRFCIKLTEPTGARIPS